MLMRIYVDGAVVTALVGCFMLIRLGYKPSIGDIVYSIVLVALWPITVITFLFGLTMGWLEMRSAMKKQEKYSRQD